MLQQLTPVRIDFTIRTPMVVSSTAKHLDALLSWAAVQKAEFQGHQNPISMQHEIGLAKHHVGRDWCFMASHLHYDWIGEPEVVHYIKRSRLSDYSEAWGDGLFRKKPYFDGQRGVTKAGSYLQPIRWASKVSGFAIVQDMECLKGLLPWITHIGKLHHKDFGAVSSAEVEVDVSAESEWSMRTLPIESSFATRHAPAIGALQSPYWMREEFKRVAAFCDA